MKHFFYIVAAFVFCYSSRADPFAPEKKNPIREDLTSIDNASQWITDKMLRAFGEHDIGKAGTDGHCVRIFLNNKNSPILIKHYVTTVEGSPQLVVIKKINNVNGIWELTMEEKIKTDDSFERLANLIYNLADPLRLPVTDWADHKVLGGSAWVYEFPVPDGFYILVRINPLGLNPERALKASETTANVYSKEKLLASYVLVLCAKAGLEINP